MINAFRRRLTIALFAASLAASAACVPALAQDTPNPHPELDRILGRIDFGVSGAGQFTTNTSGTGESGQPVALKPSNTLGVMFTLRYTKSPFVGGEFNVAYARYTQNYTFTAVVPVTTTDPSGTVQQILAVQNNALEATFGYVVHTPKQYYGVQPFASVGLGTIDFRPTKGGGEGTTSQARAAYYYNVGAETTAFAPYFGIRVSFRQLFANAPDFQETYLRDHRHAVTSEPTAGFFLRF